MTVHCFVFNKGIIKNLMCLISLLMLYIVNIFLMSFTKSMNRFWCSCKVGNAPMVLVSSMARCFICASQFSFSSKIHVFGLICSRYGHIVYFVVVQEWWYLFISFIEYGVVCFSCIYWKLFALNQSKSDAVGFFPAMLLSSALLSSVINTLVLSANNLSFCSFGMLSGMSFV